MSKCESCGYDKTVDSAPALVELDKINYNIDDLRGKFVDSKGVEQEWFDECAALGLLLLSEKCFINQRKYVCIDGSTDKSTTVVFMLCNDVFMWASSDGECLLNEDIKPLFMMWHADKKWGDVRWVCIKRQEQPQRAIAVDMKKTVHGMK